MDDGVKTLWKEKVVVWVVVLVVVLVVALS